MKAIHFSIAAFILLVCTNNTQAQKSDSSASNHRFRIGFDLLKPWSPLFVEEENNKKSNRIKFEFLTAYHLTNTFSANFDIGFAKGLQYAYNGVQRYESNGVYVKPGIEVYLLDPSSFHSANSQFFLGYRLGLSFYKEKNQYQFRSNFWNSDYVEESNWQSFTYWHEFSSTARIVLFRTEKSIFNVGITPRLRIKTQKSEHTRLFIPGYGGNDPFNVAINIDLGMEF